MFEVKFPAAILSGLILTFSIAYSDAPFIEETVVFQRYTEGYNIYRIPAIIRTWNNDLLAFCEGREYSDDGNIDIIMKRSRDNGHTWDSLTVIVDHTAYMPRYNDHKVVCGNMVPVVDDSTGVIWLAFNMSGNLYSDDNGLPAILRGDAGVERTVWVTSSADHGATWTEPVEITSSVKPAQWRWYSNGPVHGIQLNSGRLLIPACHSDEFGTFSSHVFYSDDHGISWQLGGPVGPDTDESTVIQLTDGAVMINMRNYRHGGQPQKRAIAISKDEGETWGPIWDDDQLIEPRCQASIIRFTDRETHSRDRILFSNPEDTLRINMTVKISYDEGLSWNSGKTIHQVAAAYSDLVIMADLTIGCLYENALSVVDGYAFISFARFNLEWATDVSTKPRIISIDSVCAMEDIAFHYIAEVKDPEEPSLSWQFKKLPHWLRQVSNSVQGTPREGDVDTSFMVIAFSNDQYDTLDVTVQVSPFNDPPDPFEILSPKDSSSIILSSDRMGDSLVFDWESAIDVDSDSIYYTFVFTDSLSLLKLPKSRESHYILRFADLQSIMRANNAISLTGTWTVAASDGECSVMAVNGPFLLRITDTSLDVDNHAAIHDAYYLLQNYPNPFNSNTSILYYLSVPSEAIIGIYDLRGRFVRHLVSQYEQAGLKSISWDGRGDSGVQVSGGIYYCFLRTNNSQKVVKMIYLK